MIAIVTACGNKKESVPLPAYKLYKSSRIKAVYNRRQNHDMFILSAEHGLIPAEKVIAPYNRLMAEHFNVTDDERKELTPIAKRPKFNVQIRWAVSELRKAHLLENIREMRGIFKITGRGLDVLNINPKILNNKFLKKYPEYSDWLKNTSNIRKINKKPRANQLKEKFGLILYIDMLGTQDLWRHSDSKNISDKWNKFIRTLYDLLSGVFKNPSEITFSTFFDTIIITIENKDIDYLLKNFGSATWSSIVNSIKLDIPIRGCFSIGKFFHKGNFFIGKTVSEAAQYYEMPQWIGISASPSAHAAIEKLSKNDLSDYYRKCSIPLKQSIEQDAWAINWPELYDSMSSTSTNDEPKHILEIIDEKIDTITDIDIVLKWRNTKKFYDYVINNDDKTNDAKNNAFYEDRFYG